MGGLTNEEREIGYQVIVYVRATSATSKFSKLQVTDEAFICEERGLLRSLRQVWGSLFSIPESYGDSRILATGMKDPHPTSAKTSSGKLELS